MPFSIKDLLDTADASTQRGSRLFAGFPTSIPLMKTNNPECGTWTESDNIVTGRTNNPWNLDRTAGGSSGWRGRGHCGRFLADWHRERLGNLDSGPSRLQWHCHLESDPRSDSCAGHFPTVMRRLRQVGPMARTISDVAVGYKILTGPDGIDPYVIYAKDVDPRFAGGPVRIRSDAAFRLAIRRLSPPWPQT
jgi:aspartyl-tRNA(Asn)/glutamyl-tRNA(Gln) amidotransferase subunit A